MSDEMTLQSMVISSWVSWKKMMCVSPPPPEEEKFFETGEGLMFVNSVVLSEDGKYASLTLGRLGTVRYKVLASDRIWIRK